MSRYRSYGCHIQRYPFIDYDNNIAARRAVVSRCATSAMRSVCVTPVSEAIAPGAAASDTRCRLVERSAQNAPVPVGRGRGNQPTLARGQIRAAAAIDREYETPAADAAQFQESRLSRRDPHLRVAAVPAANMDIFGNIAAK